jgi:hypothetical protein
MIASTHRCPHCAQPARHTGPSPDGAAALYWCHYCGRTHRVPNVFAPRWEGALAAPAPVDLGAVFLGHLRFLLERRRLFASHELGRDLLDRAIYRRYLDLVAMGKREEARAAVAGVRETMGAT